MTRSVTIFVRRVSHALRRRTRVEAIFGRHARTQALRLARHVASVRAAEGDISRETLPNSSDLLRGALALYRAGDAAQALDILEAGLLRNPDDVALTDNFLRIAITHGRAERPSKILRPESGSAACKRLLDEGGPWSTQVGLVIHCAKAGYWDVADPHIERLIETCDDTWPIWHLSDMLLGEGRKENADRIYRRLSEAPAKDPESAVLHGLALERLGAPEKAVDRLEAELSLYPDVASIREHLIRICMLCGRIQQTAQLLGRQVVDADALDMLFDTFRDGGHQLKLIDYCLENGQLGLVKQRLSTAHLNLSNVSLWTIAQGMASRGLTHDANDLFRTVVAKPQANASDAYFAAAAALSLGDMELALNGLEESQRAFPDAPELHTLYVQLCANRLDFPRYVSSRTALGGAEVKSFVDFYVAAIEANSLEAIIIHYYDIAAMCSPEEFEHIRLRAITTLRSKTVPFHNARLIAFFCKYLDVDAAVCEALASALTSQYAGEANEAERRILEVLYTLTPPMVRNHHSAEQIMKAFIDGCRSFASDPLELHDPILDMSDNWTPWQFLFCTGRLEDYPRAMAAFEQMAIKTWPRLGYRAPHVAGSRTREPGDKIRIGFIVHDSMPMMSGLLQALDPSRFETVFLHPGPPGQSKAAKNWSLRAGRVVSFADKDTYQAIETIAAERLDIIVSGPSVASVFFPMLARLAPLQMVLLEPNWTDGCTNGDYYVSWRPAEPEQPETFYRSKVAYLEHPPYYIERPVVTEMSEPARLEIRQRLLGPRAGDRIYLCANTPPKIHPDMDRMFRELLERDPGGTIVMLRGEYPPAKTLKARLARELGPLMERVVYLPSLKQDEAHALLLSADACLDSFPLCGMSSSFDAAMLGVPIVTLPTEIPFGKWTATIYDYIGVSGLTAASREEYIEIALRLAHDPAWREALAAELREKAARFVESTESSAEVAAFIERAWERHLAGSPPEDWIAGAWRPRPEILQRAS